MTARREGKTEKRNDVRPTVTPQRSLDGREGEPVGRDQAAERSAALKELTCLSEDAGLYDADYRSLLEKSR